MQVTLNMNIQHCQQKMMKINLKKKIFTRKYFSKTITDTSIAEIKLIHQQMKLC